MPTDTLYGRCTRIKLAACGALPVSVSEFCIKESFIPLKYLEPNYLSLVAPKEILPRRFCQNT